MCAKKSHVPRHNPNKRRSADIKRNRRRRQEQRRRDARMTKKYGKHGHGACGRKKCYESEQQAATRAFLSMKMFGFSYLRPYKCKFCGKWHLTSMPYRQDEKDD